MRAPLRASEVLLVLALVAGGTAVRWWHLGTPSLWWDELVHVRTAEQPTAAAVWHAARDGGAPGSGNAGAVPLDYLALHAWLAATPHPTPATLERHVRTPAFAFAALALPAAWLVGRAAAGPAAGVAALALLATSLPHVLYAAEARFYSLYVLATLASLGAFVALVRHPTWGRGLAFVAANTACVLAALYGVFPVAAEHVVVAWLAWARRRERAGRVLAGTVALGGVAAGVALGLWLTPSALATVYPRGAPADLGVASAARDTLAFLSGGSRALGIVLALGLVGAPLLVRRGPARALAGAIVLSLGAIGAIVVIARWKHYYYHPRHALFLLPMAHLATAMGFARVAEWTRPMRGASLAAALVLGLTAPTLAAYLADPLPFFHASKTLRDVRGLVEAVGARARTLAPDERYLLVLEKRRPGHLANPTVAFYLEAHALTGRVMLAGVGDPGPLLAALPVTCAETCGKPLDVPRLVRLGLRDPFDQSREVRRLLSLTPQAPGPRVGAIGVVAWAPNVPAATPPGLVATPKDGLALYETAAR